MNNAINAFNSYRVDGNNEVMIDNFDLNRYSKYLNDSLKEYDLRAQGQTTVVDNGDVFAQEQNYGRITYINAVGTLQWECLSYRMVKNSLSTGRYCYANKIFSKPGLVIMKPIKCCIFFLLIISSMSAHAYIGPGMGGGVIAAVLAIIGAIFLALFGILYYPIKRALKNRSKENKQRDKEDRSEDISKESESH